LILTSTTCSQRATKKLTRRRARTKRGREDPGPGQSTREIAGTMTGSVGETPAPQKTVHVDIAATEVKNVVIEEADAVGATVETAIETAEEGDQGAQGEGRVVQRIEEEDAARQKRTLDRSSYWERSIEGQLQRRWTSDSSFKSTRSLREADAAKVLFTSVRSG